MDALRCSGVFQLEMDLSVEMKPQGVSTVIRGNQVIQLP